MHSAESCCLEFSMQSVQFMEQKTTSDIYLPIKALSLFCVAWKLVYQVAINYYEDNMAESLLSHIAPYATCLKTSVCAFNISDDDVHCIWLSFCWRIHCARVAERYHRQLGSDTEVVSPLFIPWIYLISLHLAVIRVTIILPV